MQTNNTLILGDNHFANTKEEVIKSAKIMIKDKKYLILVYCLKFNGAQIKLKFKIIVLIKQSHIGGVFSVTNHAPNSTSSRRVTKRKLLSKK